jgi:hypothetical protein
MAHKWMPLVGEFEQAGEDILFTGRITREEEPRQAAATLAISDQRFSGGAMATEFQFEAPDHLTAAEIVFWYDPTTRNMLTAGLGGSGQMGSIRGYFETSLTENKWTVYASTVGSTWHNIKPSTPYAVHVEIQGSRVTLVVNGVTLLSVNLPFPIPPSQPGVLFLGGGNIRAHNYIVKGRRSSAFVVMDFSGEYDELYADVIQKACESQELDVKRADERYGPGLIIADIINDLNESKLVIAEISPPNPNVFFEVGYAYAVNKPVILLALKGTKLPFDVSPFRTLFYENTIGGKARVEAALVEHLKATLGIQPNS